MIKMWAILHHNTYLFYLAQVTLDLWFVVL